MHIATIHTHTHTFAITHQMQNRLHFGIPAPIKQTVINAGVDAALHNSGVMRHGLNANYYATHGRPALAIREGSAALWDAMTGSRK